MFTSVDYNNKSIAELEEAYKNISKQEEILRQMKIDIYNQYAEKLVSYMTDDKTKAMLDEIAREPKIARILRDHDDEIDATPKELIVTSYSIFSNMIKKIIKKEMPNMIPTSIFREIAERWENSEYYEFSTKMNSVIKEEMPTLPKRYYSMEIAKIYEARLAEQARQQKNAERYKSQKAGQRKIADLNCFFHKN